LRRALRARGVDLLSHDLSVGVLQELPLAPHAPAFDLPLELERQAGRELVGRPAQQLAWRAPPRRKLVHDRVAAGEAYAPPGDEGVEVSLRRVGGSKRLEIGRLVAPAENLRIHRHNETMPETAYQAVPAIAADERAPHAGTVVMKFGGTSVEGPERIKAVARRLAVARRRGDRVVGVLSAMGDTTDE